MKPATHEQSTTSVSGPPGSVSHRRSLGAALRNWSAVMGLLMVDQLNQRTRRGKFGFFIIIAEPFILVGMFYLLRGLFRGLIQQYGDSLLLFIVSGLLPFYLFLRTSIQARRAQINPSRRLPRITSLDVFMAGVAVQAAIWIPVIAATLLGMWLYGIDRARPASIADCMSALFFLTMLGAGLGLINSVISRFVAVWPIIIGSAMRGMIFLSGVIHIPDFFRPSVRAWLAWNPILHGIDWFRLGVYGRYPTLLLDQSYLVKCAIILLFIGIVADRATLRHGADRS